MKRTTIFSKWLADKLGLSAAALGLLLSAGVFGADNGPDSRPIDWDRAKALHQREVSGERLSPEDQAYLDRAKALIQSGQGPGQRPGAPQADGIDTRKARELYQKSQRGETLTADEQAYLDKAKAARQRAVTQPAGETAGIDRQRARELFQKSQRGETLTTDEQAYLDKVKVIMQRRQGQGGQHLARCRASRPLPSRNPPDSFPSPNSPATRNTRAGTADSMAAGATRRRKPSSKPPKRCRPRWSCSMPAENHHPTARPS